ncbi:MAG: hypothetical protein EOO44_12195 [Flavobacterium sp.]|nr:MAG: hypothetical protein EOO44_12195 [Flavobacterium sp.]
MANWNKYKSCNNCIGNEWSHLARGYCQKCYPLIKDLEKVEAWNVLDSTTINNVRGVSKDFMMAAIRDGKFHDYQKIIITLLKNRLKIFRSYINPNGYAFDIEILLTNISDVYCTNGTKNIFRGHAALYESDMRIEQRKVFEKALLELEINRNLTLDTNLISKLNRKPTIIDP